MDDLLLPSSDDDESICTDDFTPHCKDLIRIDYVADLKEGFFRETDVEFYEELLTTNPILIAFIAGVSTAATLVVVGVVFGISR